MLNKTKNKNRKTFVEEGVSMVNILIALSFFAILVLGIFSYIHQDSSMDNVLSSSKEQSENDLINQSVSSTSVSKVEFSTQGEAVVDKATLIDEQNDYDIDISSVPTVKYTINGKKSFTVKGGETATVVHKTSNADQVSLITEIKNCLDPQSNYDLGESEYTTEGTNDITFDHLDIRGMDGCDLIYTIVAKNSVNKQQAEDSLTIYIRPENILIEKNTCGIVSDSDGNEYGTVKIGSQCWTTQNMKNGVMLNDATDIPKDNNLIEKWCMNNDKIICDKEGGLYTWSEALQLDPKCNISSCKLSTKIQGICPKGWHIPTDKEYGALEMSLGMTKEEVGMTGWRGGNQGDMLQVGGSSGFQAIFSGARRFDDRDLKYGFYERGAHAVFWTISEVSKDKVQIRDLLNGKSEINLEVAPKVMGISVRCVKD
jgi:uncharacterized protein (TIGR02145 family)